MDEIKGTFLGNGEIKPMVTLVCVDGEVVRTAEVVVSRQDRNWHGDETVSVRRAAE
jgi:hypothetical protein